MAAAFYPETGFLAPGKDDPMVTEANAENRSRSWRLFVAGYRCAEQAPSPAREALTEQTDKTMKLVTDVLDVIRHNPKARKAVEAALPAALKAKIHELLRAALAREGE